MSAVSFPLFCFLFCETVEMLNVTFYRIGNMVSVGYEQVVSSPTSSLFAYAWSRGVSPCAVELNCAVLAADDSIASLKASC